MFAHGSVLIFAVIKCTYSEYNPCLLSPAPPAQTRRTPGASSDDSPQFPAASKIEGYITQPISHTPQIYILWIILLAFDEIYFGPFYVWSSCTAFVWPPHRPRLQTWTGTFTLTFCLPSSLYVGFAKSKSRIIVSNSTRLDQLYEWRTDLALYVLIMCYKLE